ncbi:T9SS type A sorting domain-containing protein [Flavobacterium sp. NG2]|uniref:T9SS type A sorting domain-containing protein n=1 Tax=Flavobacterium sp. NG2 TaxID=3097547 RepID=UPI002A8053CC|nr:T9SS type A sorting domain-containing protein [Flavobacterium sp. NG2]WPR71404.1 T9SS type A sorting domain-containing protein [Flavobacterium sp. NG2]
MKNFKKYSKYFLFFVLQWGTTVIFAQENTAVPYTIRCGETVNDAKISLSSGNYKMYLKVWVANGTDIKGIKTSLNPVAKELSWDFKNLVQGQWVTLSQEFSIEESITDQIFEVEILEDDYSGVGAGNFYLDAFYIEFVSSLGTEDFENSTVTIFPNPVTDLLNINCPIGSSVMLYNNSGMLVKKINTHEELSQFPISNLASGVYVLKITNAEKIFSRKIIIR